MRMMVMVMMICYFLVFICSSIGFSVLHNFSFFRFSIRKWKWLVRARSIFHHYHVFCYYVLKQLCDILLDFLFHPNLLTKLSKVGSTKNIRHSAGGGDVKVFGNTASIFITKQTTNTIQNIEMQKNWKKEHKTQNVEMHPFLQIHDEKVEFRVGSRVGSLANVKVLQCCAIFPCSLLMIVWLGRWLTWRY